MTLTISAPGKVVLLGEYAVLEGAPALVMAVDRRVRATLSPGPGPACSVSAPAWTAGTARFDIGPQGVSWATCNVPGLELAGHVIRRFFDRHGAALTCAPFHLELDSSALMAPGPGSPAKLGLGSSAAVTVATWHALGYYAATQQSRHPHSALAELVEVHAAFQGNRGSGLDIAASLFGGLIEYRRSPGPGATASRLPPDVDYVFVWSGEQAVTGRFLAGLEAWRRARPGSHRGHMSALRELSEAGTRAAAGGDGDEFLRLVAEYGAAMEALGKASGTDILSVPHREIHALAVKSGVAYKPCGAGGGDIGVAMSRDPGALARFRDTLATGRFQALALRIDNNGVTTRSGN